MSVYTLYTAGTQISKSHPSMEKTRTTNSVFPCTPRSRESHLDGIQSISTKNSVEKKSGNSRILKSMASIVTLDLPSYFTVRQTKKKENPGSISQSAE